MQDTDRRIKLRDGLYALVERAASKRFVSPTQLVVMAVCDFLQKSGELDAPQVQPAAPAPTPVTRVIDTMQRSSTHSPENYHNRPSAQTERPSIDPELVAKIEEEWGPEDEDDE